MDEFLILENQKVSYEKEEHDNDESEFDGNELYQMENTSLEDKKKNWNDVGMCFNEDLKMHIGLKIRIIWHVYMITK